MKKAVLLDFYGTVVQESYGVLSEIAEEFLKKGAKAPKKEIEALWWPEFRRYCDAAHGDAFITQKEIYPLVFREMAKKTGAEGVDEEALKERIVRFAERSEMFEDAHRFLAECPLPYYILSNIDNAEIEKIIAFHGLHPRGVFTSEDAREYKPRKGVFEKGLRAFGLSAEDAVYAGDSLRNDFYGAESAGICAVWLNRMGEPVPDGVRAANDLYGLFGLLEKL